MANSASPFPPVCYAGKLRKGGMSIVTEPGRGWLTLMPDSATSRDGPQIVTVDTSSTLFCETRFTSIRMRPTGFCLGLDSAGAAALKY